MDGWMNEPLIDRQTHSSRRQMRGGEAKNLIHPLQSNPLQKKKKYRHKEKM